MSDLFEDSDLLSEDYRRKDDDLDDDLDDQLLYSSEEEKEDFSKPVVDLEIAQSTPILSKIDQDKVHHNLVPTDASSFDASSVSSNVAIVNRNLSSINDSDSEGTDTRDETDDRPLNGDDTARKKIKIYRRISNISNNATTILEPAAVSTEDTTLVEAEASVNFEDEDSDGDEKSGRDRFRSERDVKTLDIGSKRRNSDSRNIPDTLEISQEDKRKIEEFNQQQKEKRFNKRNHGRFTKRGSMPQPRFFGRGNFLPFSNLGGAKRATLNPHQVVPGNPPFQQSILGNPPPNIWPIMRQPPPISSIPMSIPPPWFPPRNLPPPILPVHSIGSLLNTQTLQSPPTIAVQTHVAQTSVAQPPVVQPLTSVAPIAEKVVLDTTVQQNQGNPIPTVMSLSKRGSADDTDKSLHPKPRRQAIFDDANRSSPKLSVKITRSRSKSPVPRNSKRVVLKPRRSRSRSPKPRSSRRRERSPKKRSRRRSRSYSPRRRSRSRSYSPRRRSPSSRRNSPSSNRSSPNPSKPGKILINPHFKGARKLPTTALQTPATSTSVVNSLFSFPPPLLPGVNSLPRPHPSVNINLPPPPLPGVVSSSLSSRPPSVTVPPPGIHPNVSASPTITQSPVPSAVNPGTINLVPPPLLPPRPNVPPPILHPTATPSGVSSNPPPPGVVPNQSARPPTAVDPTRPPPLNPNLPPPAATSTRFATAPPIDVTRPPPPSVFNIRTGPVVVEQNKPRFVQAMRPTYRLPERTPSAFIRSTFGDNGRKQKFDNERESLNSSSSTREMTLSGSQVRSRLKPPPLSSSKKNTSSQGWKNNVASNVEYEKQMKQQAEKRQQILQLKAQRRGKDDPSNPLVAVIRGISPLPTTRTVRISNIASATSHESIARLMKNIGPIEGLDFKSDEKCFVGSFKSAAHAKEFTEKYNRYMLDLSYISISLVG